MIVHRFEEGDKLIIQRGSVTETQEPNAGEWLVLFTHSREGEGDDREFLVALFKACVEGENPEFFDYLMRVMADMATEDETLQ